jgi:hypothetical protein
MKTRKALGVIAAAGLLGMSAASAQTTAVWTCPFSSWCLNQVVVGPSGGKLEYDQIHMEKGIHTATMLWILYGGPDDEFRGDSVVFTGTSATGAETQFPLRQLTPTRFALDNLNTSGLTYTYEVRVYKKGTPGMAPVVMRGSIVNAP